MFNTLKKEFNRFNVIFLSFFPGILGVKLRSILLNFKSSSKGLIVREFCYFEHIHNIEIGNNVTINQRAIFNGAAGLEIRDNVLIGPRVTIYTTNHLYMDKDKNINSQGSEFKKVIIEEDVWICTGAIILPGVTLKKGTVVAAGSVVTKSTDSYSVVAGSPARHIKYRE